MANEETLADAMNNDATYPTTDVDGELNPGNNTEFEVDSMPSNMAKDLTKANKAQGKKKCAKNDPMQPMKTTIIVSGVILILAGAIFAINKKIREK
uniref:Uncharacterized protein n=1 Tax=Chenopodium quinoa TaxID=63459 RepID=A0A803L2V6_CHEQI